MKAPTMLKAAQSGLSPVRPHGFTLVQLLVVLGIAAVLMSLALPAIMRARTSAKRTAMFYQLQMISTALEAYKQDFDEYPQIDLNNGVPPLIVDTGSFALARSLIGPAPATAPPGNLADGKDGPGFRMTATGKVYGPYIAPDNFTFGYSVSNGAGGYELSAPAITLFPPDYGRLVIADRSNKPIVYCPALPRKPRYTLPSVYFAGRKPTSAGNGTPSTAALTDVFFYDFNNILGDPAVNTSTVLNEYRGLLRQPTDTDDSKVVMRLQQMLGDKNNNGRLDPGESPSIDAPFILWSAGIDGVFGPLEGGNKPADDIFFTNFGQ